MAQDEKSENTRKCSKKRANSLILNSNSPHKTETKTKQRKTIFSTDYHDACKEHKVEKEENFDQEEEERVEKVEEFLDKAYKNFLNSTPTSTTYSTSCFVYESDTDEEFEEFYAALAYDQPTDEDDEINHQTVEEFLESAYNNLLNHFNDNHDVHKPKGD